MKFRLFYFRGSPFSSRAPLTSVQESSQPVVIEPELLPRLTLPTLRWLPSLIGLRQCDGDARTAVRSLFLRGQLPR